MNDPEHCKVTSIHTAVVKDGKTVCKYCGLGRGPEPRGVCLAKGCCVYLFDPDEDYCQHHEGYRSFGAA